ncbi:hypothetical protein [Paenibacillus polymyxa]|uniref:hypothetical protein n=1 Tax=Paenibacillus polymyxa TaxID=1406 RepID=UPI000589FA41|nr:hypothetical protein [Paenibacillus polymyxa]AJE54172.1 hypothetical protein RE92_24490 [Paenibacillus polymyxa]
MNTTNNNQPTLLEQLRQPLKTITVPILEASLDLFIENSILKAVPAINALLEVAKLSSTVSNHFLYCKMIRFIAGAEELDLEERKHFLNKHEKNHAKLNQQLLLHLERLDELNKADLFANLFKARVLLSLTETEFYRLSHILQKVFYDDLLFLKKHANEKVLLGTQAEHLATVGLVRGISGFTFAEAEVNIEAFELQDEFLKSEQYVISKAGHLFIQYGLNHIPSGYPDL